MPINPKHFGGMQFLDNSNEESGFSFNFGPITALTIAAFLTQFGAFRTATDAITIGSLVSDQWTGDKTIYTRVVPSDVNAQRERKFLVTYEGVTTHSKYDLEIPTADFTGRMVADTDKVDLTDTEVAAWITAFETLCKTPEGEAVNVLSITGVGRNL